jgi:hypothetical protein
MGKRTWIKIYCDKWLEGTLREETPEVRGVWIDLLTLAGSGPYGDTGEIKLTNGIGFTDKQIAEILHIPLRLWQQAKAKLIETDRIKVTSKEAISIVNWSKYQSEYRRQKQYRQQETANLADETDNSTSEPKSPFTNPPRDRDRDIEIESQKLHKEVTTKSYNEELQPKVTVPCVKADGSCSQPDRSQVFKHFSCKYRPEECQFYSQEQTVLTRV